MSPQPRLHREFRGHDAVDTVDSGMFQRNAVSLGRPGEGLIDSEKVTLSEKENAREQSNSVLLHIFLHCRLQAIAK